LAKQVDKKSRPQFTNLGLQNYNSNFRLHLVVIVIRRRMTSTSSSCTDERHRMSSCIDMSSSCVIVTYRYCLCVSWRALRRLLTCTSTTHFLVCYCASSSLYLAIARCRRSDKADHCFL